MLKKPNVVLQLIWFFGFLEKKENERISVGMPLQECVDLVLGRESLDKHMPQDVSALMAHSAMFLGEETLCASEQS